MPEPLCPNCPLCGGPPLNGIVFGGGTQAFCGNEDCTAWIWDPSRSLDENLLDDGKVTLTETPLPRPDPGDSADETTGTGDDDG